MKYLSFILIICLLSTVQCKKDSKEAEYAVVEIVEKGPFSEGTFTALVENPDPAKYKFLCTLGTDEPMPKYNCTNAVYLKNLPPSLAVIGKKIRFSTFKDDGQPMPFSSINHAHVLTVGNPVEVK